MTPKPRDSRGKPQLRIIGGMWRSRRIGFPDVEGLRPTGDRIRETLFNWLAPHIAEARCLDAFAGSGALGFEALSRGAGDVVFVEKDPVAYRHLTTCKEQLAAESATIINEEFLRWAASAPREPFDIIFLDPPFAANLYRPAIEAIRAGGLARNRTLVYLECPLAEVIETPADWRCIREKTGGGVRFRLFQPD